MIFSNYTVISNKIQINNFLLNLKSFAASLFVHATVLSLALYISVYTPIELPKEKPIMISLADISPTHLTNHIDSSKNIPIKSTQPQAPKMTSQKRLSPTPAVSPEVSAPQTSTVRPDVAPSDIQPKTKESLHSIQKPIANDSPHDASSLLKTNELPKPNVSNEDINGATLGRIRALIENSLIYPPIARKLRLEGTVVVSFILKPDGLVEKAEIVTSSGSNILDKKAIQTVLELSGDYPPLTNTAYLTIPIAFSPKKS
jgi:TonB family protein